jgi:hypothetical protein
MVPRSCLFMAGWGRGYMTCLKSGTSQLAIHSALPTLLDDFLLVSAWWPLPTTMEP